MHEQRRDVSSSTNSFYFHAVNIVALGLANLFGGLFVIVHNVSFPIFFLILVCLITKSTQMHNIISGYNYIDIYIQHCISFALDSFLIFERRDKKQEVKRKQNRPVDTGNYLADRKISGDM